MKRHSNPNCLRPMKSALLLFLLAAVAMMIPFPTWAVGTWTALAHTAPGAQMNNMLLLPDGTVMAHDVNNSTAWYKLTPAANGSYANGTWSTLASMHNSREYFSTQVLPDGRVFACGGEYGNGSPNGEVYDPKSNTWTLIPTTPQVEKFLDSCSEILPNGDVIVGPVAPGVYGGTLIWHAAAGTWVDGPTLVRGNDEDEAAWVTLADQSILTIDFNTQNSERFIPSQNKWVNDANVPVDMYGYGGELGAAFLLPNGNAFFLGGTSNTVTYTPTGTTSPGTWTAGPNIPNGYGVVDGPAAMMNNGKILCCVGVTTGFGSSCYFYEYDYVANAFTAAPSPSSATAGASFSVPEFVVAMLDLPNGQVLASRQNNQLYVYTPDGSPLAAGQPVINTISPNPDGSYHLTGTQFNGISEGAAYGDDMQMRGNYPIARLTNSSGTVYYGRTYNWSSLGVMTGTNIVTTELAMPSGLPAGTYSLVITANGIPSAPLSITYPNTNSFFWDVWTGGVNANWDIAATANWTSNGIATTYADGNSVLFNDAAAQTNVSLAAPVSPNIILVTNNSVDYTFSGSPIISGSLTKSGTGALTLASANTYAGGTMVSAGTLNVNTGSALGGAAVTLGNTNSGTNAISLFANVNFANPISFTANGTGPILLANRGSGIITLSGLVTAQRDLVISNNSATVNSFTFNGGLGGTNTAATVTFYGGGGVKIQGDTSGFLGNFNVLPSPGLMNSLLNINSALSINTDINLGGTNTQLGIVNSPTFNSLTGNGVVLAGPGQGNVNTTTIGAGGGSGTFSGTFTTNALGIYTKIVKTGSGTEIFAGTNSAYSAPVTITGGTLQLNSPKAAGTGTITDNGTLAINIGANTFANTVTGTNTMNVLLTANATTTLGGSLSSFTGKLNIPTSSGTSAKVALSGSISASGTVNIASGGTLSVASVVIPATVNVSGGGNSEGFGALRVETGATISGAVNLLGDTAIGESGNGVISGVIGDGGSDFSLIKVGGGTLTLSGANTYSGNTIISNGTLKLAATGSIASSPVINLASNTIFDVSANSGFALATNQTLSGFGTVNGNLTAPAGSQIIPGGTGVVGTLTFNNNVTLTNPSFTFDLSTNPVSGNDLVQIAGTLTNNGTTTIALNYLAGSLSAGTYTLFTYASLAGSGTFALITGYPNVTLNVGSTAVTLTVGAGGSSTNDIPSGNLTWTGDGVNNLWDVQTSTNWTDAGNPIVFYQGFNVVFDDTGSASPAVSLMTVLQPNSVVVNASQNYTFDNGVSNPFSSPGQLSGSMNLFKYGVGVLTLNTLNTYTGGTIVSNGTLLVDGALGNGAVTVAAAGTLGGTGLIGGAVVLNGAISPGNANGVGTLTTGGEIWSNNAVYAFGLNNATNSGGQDSLNVNGTLNLQAFTVSGFGGTLPGTITVKLVSLTVSNTPGLLTGFASDINYTWPLATASGGITNFIPSVFKVNTTGFSNLFAGKFNVGTNGNSLVLNYVAPPLVTPVINATSFGTNSFAMSFNGTNLQTYEVLASTNLLLPLTNWWVLTNGTFGTNTVNFADPNATNPQEFYRVTSP